MAGVFCVLEKEGLGFLQFTLVLRAVEQEYRLLWARTQLHTPNRAVIYTVRPHKRSDGLFVRKCERTTSKSRKVVLSNKTQQAEKSDQMRERGRSGEEVIKRPHGRVHRKWVFVHGFFLSLLGPLFPPSHRPTVHPRPRHSHSHITCTLADGILSRSA